MNGKEIRELRLRAGLNQRECALVLGLKTDQTIHLYETGKGNPSAFALERLKEFSAYLDYRDILQKLGEWPAVEAKIESLRQRVAELRPLAALIAVITPEKFKQLADRRYQEILRPKEELNWIRITLQVKEGELKRAQNDLAYWQKEMETRPMAARAQAGIYQRDIEGKKKEIEVLQASLTAKQRSLNV